MQTPQIISSEDGSPTLFVAELHEHYHSIHGAYSESMHVYIQSALHEKMKEQSEISVFEMGFGTGLNALLTLLEAESHKLKVKYTCIEKYPLPEEIYQNLSYTSLKEKENTDEIFQALHRCSWNETHHFGNTFELTKYQGDLCDFILPEIFFDVIYYDAFAPDKQPDLWTSAIFEKLAGHCHAGAILSTYCCKGDVRRAMKSAGFQVNKIPGPVGKREISRGRYLPV